MIEVLYHQMLPVPFVRSGLFRYTGKCLGDAPDIHQAFQFTCVLSGGFNIEFSSGECCELEAGDLLIISPEMSHLWSSSSVGRTEVLALFCMGLPKDIFGSLGDFLAPYVREVFWRVKFPVEEARRLAREIMEIRDSDSLVKPALLYGAHCAMLAKFGERLLRQYDAPVTGVPSSLIRVMYLIEREYSNVLALEELAEAAGLSVSRLSSLFKRHLGLAPVHYLNRFRLERAGDMLRYTDSPINEVANRTGFNSQHYFCRQFRKYAGISPSEYRNIVIEGGGERGYR